MRLRARHYANGNEVDIVVEKGIIQSTAETSGAQVDLRAQWVAPAFFDLQINGCHGHNFSSEKLSGDGVQHIVNECRKHGIGSLCPTLITNSFEAMTHGLRTIAEMSNQDSELAAALPAIHLEGPYLSAEDGPRGAHPREQIRPPNWDEFCRFQESAGGRIKLMTLAPEIDGALPFIELLTKSGVVVALGHTAATGKQIRDAVSAGARLSTHLGNGSHAFLPRHDNYIWEQLAADELWASIICDGHHLPPAVVKSILRVKTPARTILTCDASSLAGLPPGIYHDFGQKLEVLAEGKIVVADSGYFAGSWDFTDRCVNNIIRFAGVSLADAIDMAGSRPRELLGLPFQSLEAGSPADLILFDWSEGKEVRILKTIVGGTAN